MDESSVLQRNPWTDDDRSLGAVRNILLLAERTGHLDKSQGIDTEEVLNDAKVKCSSLKMIALLKHIDEQRTLIDSMSLDIQERLQDRETRDITHNDTIDRRIAAVNELSNHVQKIVGSKDHIISSLQQPYVGDYLKVEATYKRYACEVFPLLVPVLSELSQHLDDIQWASNVNINSGHLVQVLDGISSSLASLQSNFQSLNQMRETTQLLQSHRPTQAPP